MSIGKKHEQVRRDSWSWGRPDSSHQAALGDVGVTGGSHTCRRALCIGVRSEGCPPSRAWAWGCRYMYEIEMRASKRVMKDLGRHQVLFVLQCQELNPGPHIQGQCSPAEPHPCPLP